MSQKNKKILVTTALPYANGPIHLGHMVEHIQADIFVRIQKMHGHDCIFICGEDTHGTPVMISAEKQGISPEQLIGKISQEHQNNFDAFLVEFDNYYTTHSPENQQLANLIYARLRENGDINIRTIKQAYDPIKNMFLPDRYVKGECPRCASPDQYGDNCEVCGATYSPLELKNPVSAISGATPIEKESEHYFFDLERYTQSLKSWAASGSLQQEVSNKLNEWFDSGLQAWDISRDAPYFGFEIPDAPGKYFYVWLDAPIGYMASFKNLCDKHPDLNFDEYWQNNSDTQLYHFIGKDIVYFHALFWPAMLQSAGFRKPTAIFVHGYLTINGQKMSKSRGTYITAQHYLEHLDPEYLRYYFAAKLNSHVEDIDLNFDDFVARVNSDLVGKVVNIASRCAGFIHKQFNNKLASHLDSPELFKKFVDAGEKIANLYEHLEYNQAMREIMSLADMANQYIDEMKPWVLAKQPEQAHRVQEVCTMGLNFFKVIMTYLKPVLPKTSAASEQFLNIPSMNWENRKDALLNHSIQVFKPLMLRIESADINTMLS